MAMNDEQKETKKRKNNNNDDNNNNNNNNKRKKKKKEKKKTDGQPTRADYEEMLAGYEGRLAAAVAEFDLTDRAADAARAAYDEVRETHRAALREIGYQVGHLEAAVGRREADKTRLTAVLAADRAAAGAAVELGRARYDRAIGDQRLDGESVEAKYKAAALNGERRTGLLDEIVAVAERKRRLERIQRDGLYAAEQIQVFENAMLIRDQERNLQNWIEMVKKNKKCADQEEILRNKMERNIKMHELSAIQTKFYKIRNEKEKFDNRRNKLDEIMYPYAKEYFISNFTSMNNIRNRLIKKKEIVQLKKNQLINEALSQKISREEYLKNVRTSSELENNESHMMDLVNCSKKELMKVKYFREQKLDYVKKIYKEISIIIEEANKFISGESEDNPKDIKWLLNRGIVRHFNGKPEYIS